MKHQYSNRCPNSHDFETYLNQKGNPAFIQTFENHVNQCPLCQEALEGYQLTGIKTLGQYNKTRPNFRNPYSKPNIWLKQLGYAATILLVIGITTYNLWPTQTKQMPYIESPVYSFNNNEFIGSKTTTKILQNKINNQYWYIGSNDKLAVNDCFLAPGEIDKVLVNPSDASSITIQVENSDNTFNQKIIGKIKHHQKAPVFTVSISRGIKKLTSWEGM